MASLLLYPKKYLSEYIVPYDSFLETYILFTSKSRILNSFLFLQKLLLLIFLSPKFVLFPLILLRGEKKYVNFFCNNLGVL